MPKYVLYTGKKRKKSKCNRLYIEVLFLPNISPPLYVSPPSNIGPSNLSFVRICAQGVVTGGHLCGKNKTGHILLTHFFPVFPFDHPEVF